MIFFSVLSLTYFILFLFWPIGLLLSIVGQFYSLVKPFFFTLYKWQVWVIKNLDYIEFIEKPEYIKEEELIIKEKEV